MKKKQRLSHIPRSFGDTLLSGEPMKPNLPEKEEKIQVLQVKFGEFSVDKAIAIRLCHV